MSQALYRKWRPARFNEVIGQEHIVRTLRNSIAAGRIGHAYLFCGPRGTGKTTTARLIAKAVNCLNEDVTQRPCNTCPNCLAVNDGRFMDLIEIDAASNTGVDDIRDLRERINFAPSQGKYKVYIIDEVHMLSTAAFNALLKTLEEPPAHAIFVLATTEEHKVPMTIKSRCQQYNVRLLTLEEIKQRLQWIIDHENLQIEPEALSLVARQGAGSLRDAESLLDQLVTAPGDIITLERTQMVLGTATDTAVTNLTEAWLNGNGAGGLQIIHEALASGTDPRQFARQMVAYLRLLLLLQASGGDIAFEGTVEQKTAMMRQAQRAPRGGLIETIRHFNEAAITPANSWQAQLPLELAFIELLPERPLTYTPAEPRTVPIAEPVAVAVVRDPQPEPVTAVRQPTIPPIAEPTAPQSTPSKGAITLELVKGRWRDMVHKTGEANKNLPPLLNMSKPLAVEGTVVVLGFDYPIFKDKFDNTAGASQLVGEILSQLLGSHCTARCVVTSEYTVPISPQEFQDLAQELGGVVRQSS